MEQTAALLMLASGAIHAVVNAVLKSGGDKMSGRALIDGFSALLVIPLLFFVPFPSESVLWLAGSMLTHLFYLLCLIKAFDAADMSAVYPVMRGSAPVIAALVAVLLFGEPITLAVGVGVLLVSLGTAAVAWWHTPGRRALGWALATGAMTALYTVIDAQGVRAAPSALSYFAWFFFTLGITISALFAVWRGPRFLLAARSQWKPGLFAGVLSLVTYGIALLAYRLGDVPRLAALRETSILFGVAIAALVLKERVGPARLAGAGLIAAGAAVLLTVH